MKKTGQTYTLEELTDFHTHILPCVDDGSKSAGESLEMLRMSAAQGVKRIVATPHFYAKKDSPEAFFSRRNRAVSELREELLRTGKDEALPSVCVGAEVAFFSAMRMSRETPRFCIKGTELLLLEMPFEDWTYSMIDDVCYLKKERGIEPVIAHIERYFGLFERRMLDELKDAGVHIQVNAESLLHFSSRQRILKLIKEGYIDLLGSDCHNTGTRSPRLAPALEVIDMKIGREAADAIIRCGKELLLGAQTVL